MICPDKKVKTFTLIVGTTHTINFEIISYVLITTYIFNSNNQRIKSSEKGTPSAHRSAWTHTFTTNANKSANFSNPQKPNKNLLYTYRFHIFSEWFYVCFGAYNMIIMHMYANALNALLAVSG